MSANSEKIGWGIVGTLVTGLAFGGWAARDYLDDFASKGEVQVAAAKADYVLDRQMEDLVRQIAWLERKPNKTQEEFNQLKYLRRLLENMRKVRSGK